MQLDYSFPFDGRGRTASTVMRASAYRGDMQKLSNEGSHGNPVG